MIYRPAKPRSLWGFWITEWQGTFHLFYDEDINADYDKLSWQKSHDHVGHACSRDLVHWEDRPSISVKGEPGSWNEMASGGVKTGCIARRGNTFYLFAGAQQSDGVQVVGVWTSDDLENWEEHAGNPVLKPSGPYYLDKTTDSQKSVSWRDPGIWYCSDDGYYHICISSMLKEHSQSHLLGSAIGHVRSKDLIHWEHLPPFETPGLLDRFYQNEEAELIRIEDLYYLIFDGGTTGGMRTANPYRDDVRGSFYMMSTSLEGPYHSPPDDLLVGNDRGARCATTGRVVRYQDEYIYVHFSIARRPALSTPKIIQARPDGTLFLEYMPTLREMETRAIFRSINDLPESDSPDSGQWVRTGDTLHASVRLGGTVYRISEDIPDFHFTCCIRGTTAARAGVVVRIADDGDAGVFPCGVAIVLDFEAGRVFVGDAKGYPRTGWYCREIETYRIPLSREKHYHLRCLVREEHLEVYLDDRWTFTTTIPEQDKVQSGYRRHYGWGPVVPRSGAVELMAEQGDAAFSETRLAVLEPLP